MTFDTVQIPSLAERDASQDGYFKDPLAERVSIDYALFYRTFIPDAIAYTAGLIKRLTGNHCLVGIMYGYNLKMNSSFPRPAATGCFGAGQKHCALRQWISSAVRSTMAIAAWA